MLVNANFSSNHALKGGPGATWGDDIFLSAPGEPACLRVGGWVGECGCVASVGVRQGVHVFVERLAAGGKPASSVAL